MPFNMVSAFDEIEITYIPQDEIKNISNIEDLLNLLNSYLLPEKLLNSSYYNIIIETYKIPIEKYYKKDIINYETLFYLMMKK